MCGIFGIVSTDINLKKALKALDLLKHRGPDGNGFYYDGKIFLGHRRLAILDLRPEANQPMQTENSIIVFNGEIYNHLELRNKFLRDETFKTHSDTETLLYLFEKFKLKTLKFINGFFSFAFLDKLGNKLYLCRDRFGKKPLFFYKTQNIFIFSSEILPIVEYLDKTPQINKIAVWEYFTFLHSIPPKTFFKNLFKLPSANCLVLDLENLTFNFYNYWQFPNFVNEEFLKKTFPEIINDIEELLINSVESRLLADVEIGTFLSGGIDSSLITALYKLLSGKKIKTFSIGYKEYKIYDETDYANQIANFLNTEHYTLLADKQDFLEVFQKWLMDMREFTEK